MRNLEKIQVSTPYDKDHLVGRKFGDEKICIHECMRERDIKMIAGVSLLSLLNPT